MWTVKAEKRWETNRSIQFLLSLSIFLSSAAFAQPLATYENSWPKLLAHLSQCSSDHGYDPRRQQQLSENRLGAGELEWRACAYRGIESIMISTSVAPDSFRRLIEEDKEMTAGITAGKLKRSERKARLQAMLAEIKRQEDRRRSSAQRSVRDDLRRLQRSRSRSARRAVRGFF